MAKGLVESVIHQRGIHLETQGRGCYEISGQVQTIVASFGVDQGLCQVFIHHTSASLILSENADADVLRDLESFMARLVPDGDPLFVHRAEGSDDMPAHVRSVLTHSALTIPISGGQCDLGTWQGIYVWEHRLRPHRRRLTISVQD